jgi:hypothetical protein
LCSDTPLDPEKPQLARTGMSSPLGAYTEPVKTWLDEPTRDAWLRLCNEKNTTSSELLRDVMYLLVHGRTPSEMSSEDTRALLSAKGPNTVLGRFRGAA